MKWIALAVATVATAAGAQSLPPTPVPPQDPAAQDNSAEMRRADEAVRGAAQPAQRIRGAGGGAYSGAIIRRSMVKASYLGISTSPPPAALRHQLKLPDGTALVVDFVQPKSPAQQAGIRQYDLLIKLNDQLLINPEQLAVLVRTFKPGEEVQLTLMREGEAQKVSIALVEREMPPLSEIGVDVQPVPVVPWTEPPSPQPGFQPGAPPTAQKPGMDFNADGGVIMRNERSLTWLDGKRQITVTLSQDDNSIIIKDAKTGRIMFQGPLDALKDERVLPEEARGAVERLRQFLKADTDKRDQGAGAPKGR